MKPIKLKQINLGPASPSIIMGAEIFHNRAWLPDKFPGHSAHAIEGGVVISWGEGRTRFIPYGSAAVIGAVLAPRYRAALLLTLPYLVSIPMRHGLGGRWPLAKAALHVWWDALGVASAAAGSLRNRKLVL